MFAGVEDRGTASRLFGVNERQADGDDFAGLASVTGFVDRLNWLIRRECAACAAPQERWQFVDLRQSGDIVSWFDVFSGDACCHVRREIGFGCGFHDSFRLMKVVLNVQIVFAGVRLLGAGFRNGEELKLHTHGYSHEPLKMKTAVWKFEVGSKKFQEPIPRLPFTLHPSNFKLPKLLYPLSYKAERVLRFES